ncbi:hypothetical protein [Hadaka virus 1]|uniref:Uncharacterized protein n=1 Tax=Hadaka virus 1 TaxID=2703488 RepID=A0A6J4BJI1_9VIRU|nr:hypothetical protein QK729_s9gp1 [Hadaka virus 1]BBU94046.1 hypothetical protein [Hadaka virus 1]
MSSVESGEYPGLSNLGLLRKFLDEYGEADDRGHRAASNSSKDVCFLLGGQALDAGSMIVVDDYVYYQSSTKAYGLYQAVQFLDSRGPVGLRVLDARAFDGVRRLWGLRRISELADFARIVFEGKDKELVGSRDIRVPTATALMSSILIANGLEGLDLSKNN